MRRVQKPWGQELIWAESSKYLGKITTMVSGKRTSLHYHRVKDETIIVLEGTLSLEIGSTKQELKTHTLNPGDKHWIQSGVLHRFCATTDVKFVEVSTSEVIDIVRVEDDFGRVKT